MAEQTVAAPDLQTPNTTESTRHHERYVAPPVDIYETREGLVVLADVPGVAQEALEVRVDDNVLTIPRDTLELPQKAFDEFSELSSRKGKRFDAVWASWKGKFR